MFRYYESKYGAYQARQLHLLPLNKRWERVRMLERLLRSTTDTSAPLWPEMAMLSAELFALREKAVSALCLRSMWEVKLQDLRTQMALLDAASAGEDETIRLVQLAEQFAEAEDRLRRATERVETLEPEVRAVENSIRKTIVDNEALLREEAEARSPGDESG